LLMRMYRFPTMLQRVRTFFFSPRLQLFDGPDTLFLDP
jgi:hypothetical protein